MDASSFEEVHGVLAVLSEAVQRLPSMASAELLRQPLNALAGRLCEVELEAEREIKRLEQLWEL